MSPSDQELIDETLGGSHRAYELLMRRHEGLVYRIARSYAESAEAARDVSQNVFLKAHRGLRSFGGRSAFRTWIARIARNEGLSHVRSERRRAGHLELTPANTPAEPARQEAELLGRERREALLAAIGRLNPRQARAIRLRYLEELSIREMAGILACSENHVKNILFRGLQELRRRLAGPGAGSQELS